MSRRDTANAAERSEIETVVGPVYNIIDRHRDVRSGDRRFECYSFVRSGKVVHVEIQTDTREVTVVS